MERVVIDIETVPLDQSMDERYPETDRTPPANYKTDAAIDGWRAKDMEKWEADRVSSYSLNPRLGRVLCVGIGTEAERGEAGHITVHTAPTERAEYDVLEAFWKHVGEGRVITWNGAWDLRFLVTRSLLAGVMPTVAPAVIGAWFRKYTTDPHFDCKAVLLNWDVRIAGEGLGEWSRALGMTGKTPGLSGADVYPLYKLGHFDDIAAYCEQDVAMTAGIYRRLTPYYGV